MAHISHAHSQGLSRLKVAIITDTHFGKGNDSLIHDNYFARFYDEFFFPELRRRGIKRVLHLGDLYDRRRFINFDILSRSRRYFVDPIREFEVEGILGNHDIYWTESSDLNGAELLMNDADRFHIHKEATEITIDGRLILLIPWITKDNQERTMKAIERTKAKVAMGHLDLHGFEMDKGQINKHGLDPAMFAKFDRLWSGHFHHKNGDIYLGAPYEMTWADCDDPKGFHVFDTESLDIEFCQNPFTLYKKFYYDDVNRENAVLNIINNSAADFEGKYVKIYIENRAQMSLFDTIHKLITSAGVHDISVIDKVPEFAIDRNVSAGLTESVELTESVGNEDTGKIITNYVKAAKYPVHIDGGRIENEMAALYTEASQMMAQS